MPVILQTLSGQQSQGRHASCVRSWVAAVAMWGLGMGSVFGHDFRQGNLLIDHPYATPSLAGTPLGSVYFKSIRNQGSVPDRLVFASTPLAARVEIHRMHMDGKVMRMREVPALDLPAHTGVSLRHGGAGTHHLMLVDLKKPLKDGDRFDLELVFENAGKRQVSVWVQSPRNTGHPHKH